jgi:hypothetical protein
MCNLKRSLHSYAAKEASFYKRGFLTRYVSDGERQLGKFIRIHHDLKEKSKKVSRRRVDRLEDEIKQQKADRD